MTQCITLIKLYSTVPAFAIDLVFPHAYHEDRRSLTRIPVSVTCALDTPSA